jgi:mannose-6-phosphate isomerase-like protein (cupin superfamily)
MTYPDPRYDGPAGEATATYRPTDQGADLVYPNGTTVDYLATRTSTGGLFGLYRWSMGGEASGPGPHFHRTIAESFFVLSGSIRIFDGRSWRDTAPGDFVHVPPGGIHGFKNASSEPASMLIQFAPGADREGYFEGLAAWARDGRPTDQAEIDEFYRRHDNIWVPEAGM